MLRVVVDGKYPALKWVNSNRAAGWRKDKRNPLIRSHEDVCIVIISNTLAAFCPEAHEPEANFAVSRRHERCAWRSPEQYTFRHCPWEGAEASSTQRDHHPSFPHLIPINQIALIHLARIRAISQRPGRFRSEEMSLLYARSYAGMCGTLEHSGHLVERWI